MIMMIIVVASCVMEEKRIFWDWAVAKTYDVIWDGFQYGIYDSGHLWYRGRLNFVNKGQCHLTYSKTENCRFLKATDEETSSIIKWITWILCWKRFNFLFFTRSPLL